MSIGPSLQADIDMPLRRVHKTEEKENAKKNDTWKLHRLDQKKMKHESKKIFLQRE